jgi:hypothetical protein
MILFVQIKDSDDQVYHVNIVSRSSGQMPFLDKVPQNDLGEEIFWKKQVGKRLAFGLLKPDVGTF